LFESLRKLPPPSSSTKFQQDWSFPLISQLFLLNLAQKLTVQIELCESMWLPSCRQ